MSKYAITNITPIAELSKKDLGRLDTAAAYAEKSTVDYMHHGSCLRIKG